MLREKKKRLETKGGRTGSAGDFLGLSAQEAKTQACPECGGLMRYEKHDDVLEYAGRKSTIKTLGWWCTKCGEAILTGDELVKHERAFLQLKASADSDGR
jgi:YgiT-type zinc finger domain-containing protein